MSNSSQSAHNGIVSPGIAGEKKLSLWKLSIFLSSSADSGARAYSSVTTQLQSQWADVKIQAWKWRRKWKLKAKSCVCSANGTMKPW